MTTLLNLLMITTIACFIVDLSGFVNSIKRLFLRKLGLPVTPESLNWKPFDCSLCMSFWCGLAYLIITSNLNLIGITIVALCAFFSSNISGLLLLIKDLLSFVETKISKHIL